MGKFKSDNINIMSCIGANILIFSFTGINVSSTNITYIGVKLTYTDKNTDELVTRFFYSTLNNCWYANSAKIFIHDIKDNTDVKFTIYCSLNDEYYQLTNEKNIKTLKYGNINYEIINESDISETKLSTIKNVMDKVIMYFNEMGCYSNKQSLNLIPVYCDPNSSASGTLTASAYSYLTNKTINNKSYYGVVNVNGNSQYTQLNVMFHELRHRYGISANNVTYITRKCHTNEYPSLIAPIDNKFEGIHKAIQFNSGRTDAKLWIANAHSNALENIYYNSDDTCYLAANTIRSLIIYDDILPDGDVYAVNTDNINYKLVLNVTAIDYINSPFYLS